MVDGMHARHRDIAQAFVAALADRDATQRAIVELQPVADALGADDALREFFTNASVSSAQKEQAWNRACGSAVSVAAQHLARVLIAHHAIGDLHVILDAAREELDRVQDVAHVVVTSAVPLTATMRTTVARAVHHSIHRSTRMEYEVQPKLIGGFRITIEGSRAWDGSVRGRLDRLRAHLAA